MKSLPLWLKISLGGIILLGCWWRVDAFAHRDLNVDEINQYKSSHGALQPFWRPCYYAEAHSFPGDYLLTYPFIMGFKITRKWALAVPHAITALLGFYMLWLLCRRYFKHPVSWLISFSLFSCHRELIYHALELRPYSLLTTMGLSTFFCLDTLLDPSLTLSRRACAGWWTLLMLTIVYHPYGMFMIVCCGLFLVIKHGQKAGIIGLLKRRWIFWSTAVIIGVPLWLYYMQGNPMTTPQAMKRQHIEIFQYIANPLVNPLAFMKAVVGNLTGSKLADILAIGIGVRLFWPSQRRLEYAGFLGLVIILPILLPLVSDVTYQYWFLQRQYIWVMAIFTFFTGLCWEDLLKTYVR